MQFCLIVCSIFLGFTTALCSQSDGGSTSNALMLMLYWSEKTIRNFTYLPLNTRLIHKTNNRLTLITGFCFRVDPPTLLWRHMKPKNRSISIKKDNSGKNCFIFERTSVQWNVQLFTKFPRCIYKFWSVTCASYIGEFPVIVEN